MEDLNTNAKEVKVKRTRKAAVMSAPVVQATFPHVGDTQGKATNPAKAAMPLDFVLAADLAKRNADVNDFNLSGKKLGAALVTEGHSIVIALGGDDNSKWRNVASTAEITPTGSAKTPNGTIGDMRRKATKVPVTALSIPVVEYADMTTASSALNTAYLSGKKLGSVVTTKDGHLFIATGSLPTDKWASSTGDAEDKTPTGDARPDYTSAHVGDSNRKSVPTGLITCVDFPVFPIADLSTASSSLNSDPQSGVIDGAVVVGVDSGEPSLYVSKNGATWIDQTGGTEITPA